VIYFLFSSWDVPPDATSTWLDEEEYDTPPPFARNSASTGSIFIYVQDPHMVTPETCTPDAKSAHTYYGSAHTYYGSDEVIYRNEVIGTVVLVVGAS
jgi:hypothetical protein